MKETTNQLIELIKKKPYNPKKLNKLIREKTGVKLGIALADYLDQLNAPIDARIMNANNPGYDTSDEAWPFDSQGRVKE